LYLLHWPARRLQLALALLLPGCALLPNGDAAATEASATPAGPADTGPAAPGAPAFDIRVECADRRCASWSSASATCSATAG
jgi:hypothetical protein